MEENAVVPSLSDAWSDYAVSRLNSLVILGENGEENIAPAPLLCISAVGLRKYCLS